MEQVSNSEIVISDKRKEEIIKIADELLKKSNAFNADALSVNLEKFIVAHNEIVLKKVTEEAWKKVDNNGDYCGMIGKFDDSRVAVVFPPSPELDHPVNYRIIIAHELGHYFLKHYNGAQTLFCYSTNKKSEFKKILQDPKSSEAEKERVRKILLEEKEAYLFADYLLIPVEKLNYASRNNFPNLASSFGVTEDFMLRRLKADCTNG